VSLAVVKRMTGRRVIVANQPSDREPDPPPPPPELAADAALAATPPDAPQVAAAPTDAMPADRPKRNPKVAAADQRDDKGREQRDQIETPAKEGTIDADGVFKATLNDKALQYCYLTEVKQDPKLGGKLTAAVLIDESGRASKVNATGVSRNVERCIERRLRAIQFPKPVGGPVLAYIPFTFEPPPPEDVGKGGNFEVHAGGADEMRITPSAAEIKVEMARVTGMLGHCEGGEQGRITIFIKPDGRVTEAHVLGALANTDFASCVEKGVMTHARFAKSRSGVKAAVQFHLN
jgi:hypothetical protein